MIWERLGFIVWPLALSFVMVSVLAVWMSIRLFRSGAVADLKTKVWIDAVGVWGLLAFLSGLLGASVGLIVALQSVERAGAFVPTEAAGGIFIATLSPSLGTTIFGFAVFAWFLLQLRWRLLRAEVMEDVG